MNRTVKRPAGYIHQFVQIGIPYVVLCMYQFNPSLFNPQQLRAVKHKDGPMLVLAGAGSGKTRVIAHRVSYLIENEHISPDAIVAVSFTNKAARELKNRVAELVGSARVAHCHLSTFHSLGFEILRKHITRLGWKLPFAIIDGDDQAGIIKNILKDMHFHGGNSLEVQDLLGFISRVKTAHVPPLKYPGMSFNPKRRTLERVFNDYQAIRKSMNAIDFDDMIALPVELFETFDDVLSSYTDTWRYLLVDEYQDTNSLQFRFLQLLCRDRQNLMVVGDDDQSIYAFRGADSTHILEFPTFFDNVEVVSLEQNYRSHQIILDAANGVIAKNTVRHAKTLHSEKVSGDLIQAYSCPTPEAEAEFVVSQIRNIRAVKNLNYRDIAVLYRTNPQSKALEEKLFPSGMPYRIVGGTKLYDRAEIRDLLFYLRAVYAFHDELALRRILNIPRRGIAAKTLEKIDEVAQADDLTYFEALKKVSASGMLTGAADLKLREFIEIIERYHRRFMAKSAPMSETMRALVDEIHYIAYLQSSSGSDAFAQHRRDNVDILLNALDSFESHEVSEGRDGRDPGAFLLQTLLDELPRKEEETEADQITLMTLHASKGLEFPAVFIVGCEENLLPHANSLKEPALSEERRLFYVGITRARQYLTLTYARNRRKMYDMLDIEPSRFLKDIPEHTIEYHDSADMESESMREDELAAKMASRLAQMRNLFK